MSRPNSVATGWWGGGCLEGLVAPWTPSSFFNQFGDFCLATLYLFRRTIGSKKQKNKTKKRLMFYLCGAFPVLEEYVLV